MPVRPSRLWKDMPADVRVKAAEAFWQDDESTDVQVQQMEAIVVIARRMNFRPKSVQTMSVERRAKALAQVGDVSDSVATRALIAYHFAHQRPLMSAFLDALGVEHENGLIATEELKPPAREQLEAAVQAVSGQFPADDVQRYLRTLVALDGDTWAGLETLVPATA